MVSRLKEYDLIVIGTGSSMNYLDEIMQQNPGMKVAVVDKDDPGGICLTRGCIPSKMLLYPAELVRTIERANLFGIEAEVKKVDFGKVMERMRRHIDPEIGMIRKWLMNTENLDYYPATAEFAAPYTFTVGNETIKGKMIFLCTGSKPLIPSIKGLEATGYQTSDTVLGMTRMPETLAIIGGGYIAAEYGHFFSAMGSKVTVIGRNPQFIPEVEPEISTLVERELQTHLRIVTNHEVQEMENTPDGRKKVVAVNRTTGMREEVIAEEIVVAAGRASNSDILHPERGGVKVDGRGWIIIDEHMEASQPNVWVIGDADGKYPFKHVANHESQIVYHNAILRRKLEVDYHAVPYAVFTDPEIAGVGLGEKEATERYGKENLLIGFQRYEDTAKGQAMGLKDCFVKAIVESKTLKILGAHIIGPCASILIQEIINLMYSRDQTALPIIYAMHIHPALNEVVHRAFTNFMPVDEYHHILEHVYNATPEK
jgi:mycothione reductase